MKNYELPSMTQIQAYKAGTLSLSEKAELEVLMDKNPFVKEVVRSFSEENVASIQRISKRVSYKVQEKIISSKGFWSNYGVWIGLSSIAIILGSMWYFSSTSEQQQIASSKSSTETISSKPENTPKSSPVLIEEKKEENAVEVEKEKIIKTEKTVNESKNDVVDNTSNKVATEKEPSDIHTLALKDSKNTTTNQETTTQSKEQAKKDTSNKLQPTQNIKNELTEVESKSKNQSSTPQKNASEKKVKATEPKNEMKAPTTFTLAVKNVNLIAKENPKDQVVRKKSGKGSNFLKRDNVKQQKGKSYSLDDLPSYPGGDQALFNYFKGSLHPQTVSLENDTFDKSVMLVLEVNSRGKLTNHEIFGVLHPKHQEALEKAIEELPKFNPGNGEKVVYSIGITF